jgi:hypothetical protein
MAIDGALHNTHHPLEPVGSPLINPLDMNGKEPHSLAGARSADLALLEDRSGPLLLVLPAGIPLDDVTHILAACQGRTGFQSIMSRIQAHQELSGGQAMRFFQHSLQQRDELAPAVLFAFTQFQLKTPPLSAKIGPTGA